MAIPVDNRVDCTVAQGGKTHTWTDYSEGRFSDWVTLFSAGPATVTVAEAGSGSPQRHLPEATLGSLAYSRGARLAPSGLRRARSQRGPA